MADKFIKIFTIGFTKKTAEEFFSLLQNNKIDMLVDTRLRPDTQLSGFAKGRDLSYLLRNLIQCDYRHMSLMSPTDELLDQYRKDKSWELYEKEFNQLLEKRDLIASLDQSWWANHRCCLLCSEHEPEHCHRRLVAEYIASYWPNVEVVHLL